MYKDQIKRVNTKKLLNKKVRRFRIGLPRFEVFIHEIVNIYTKSEIGDLLILEFKENTKKYQLEYAIKSLNYSFFQVEEKYKVFGFSTDRIRRQVKEECPDAYIYYDFYNFAAVFGLNIFECIDLPPKR